MNTSIILNGVSYISEPVNTILPLVVADAQSFKYRLHPHFLSDNEQLFGRFTILDYKVSLSGTEPSNFLPFQNETSLTAYGYDDDRPFFLKDVYLLHNNHSNFLIKDFYIENFRFVAFDGVKIRAEFPYKNYNLMDSSDVSVLLSNIFPNGLPIDYSPFNSTNNQNVFPSSGR